VTRITRLPHGGSTDIVLFCCDHEEHEGQVRNRSVRLVCVAPSWHAVACPSRREVVLRRFVFQKRASFTELTLDLNDGLDLRTEDPFHLNVNRMEFLVFIVLTHCPMVLKQ